MLFKIALFRNAFLLWAFLELCLSQGSSRCPSLSELRQEHKITGNITGQQYNVIFWVRPDNVPVVTCNPLSNCSSVIEGYSAKTNSSSSTLTLDRLDVVDVGSWTVVGTRINTTSLTTDICYLTAAQKPTTCKIEADLDTNNLDEGDNVTLDIDISQYYCTLNHSFSLVTGNVTAELYEHDSETEIKDTRITTSVNVTENHFGSVRFIFMCEDRKWKVICTGVDKLIERIPTTTLPTTEATELTTSESSSSPSGTSPDTSPDTTPSGSPASTTTIPERPGDGGETPGAGINIALIGGVAGGALLLIIIIIILVVNRDKVRKTYKYIVNKGRDADQNQQPAVQAANSNSLKFSSINEHELNDKQCGP